MRCSCKSSRQFSQLKSLTINCYNFDSNSHSAVGTLLEWGVCQLRELWLSGDDIDDDAVATFANGFKCIAESLEVLVLSRSSIGNEGLLAVVAGLANSTSRLGFLGSGRTELFICIIAKPSQDLGAPESSRLSYQ